MNDEANNNTGGKKRNKNSQTFFQPLGLCTKGTIRVRGKLAKTNFPQPNATVRPWCHTKPYK